jgi:hypothetical protein
MRNDKNQFNNKIINKTKVINNNKTISKPSNSYKNNNNEPSYNLNINQNKFKQNKFDNSVPDYKRKRLEMENKLKQNNYIEEVENKNQQMNKLNKELSDSDIYINDISRIRLFDKIQTYPLAGVTFNRIEDAWEV